MEFHPLAERSDQALTRHNHSTGRKAARRQSRFLLTESGFSPIVRASIFARVVQAGASTGRRQISFGRIRSSAGSTKALKKAFLIIAVVVLAPMLVVSLAAIASGDWRAVGQTEAGVKISVSSVRVLKSNQRLALVRVQYKEPAELPQGGPFVEMRARVRVNCASGVAAPTSEWFYTRDHSGRFVVSKKATHDDQFGQLPEGGFADLVSTSVCGQGK